MYAVEIEAEIRDGLRVVPDEFYFSDLEQNKRKPFIVFENNPPFDDFVGIPVSRTSPVYLRRDTLTNA